LSGQHHKAPGFAGGYLLVRLRPVNDEIRAAEKKLDELCAALEGPVQNDVVIRRSLPGIGRINLATLLAEASGPLSRRDYLALRTLTGVAPVTKRSGKSCIVIMRYGAHARLRNTVYHWARVAVQYDPKCRSRYAALRQRGCSHGRAIRGVADRLLNVACVLLERQTPFDPAYGESIAA
jgi:transposase